MEWQLGQNLLPLQEKILPQHHCGVRSVGVTLMFIKISWLMVGMLRSQAVLLVGTFSAQPTVR